MKKTIIFLLNLTIISCIVVAQPSWTVNEGLYQHNMTVTATVSIEGAESSDVDDMVGAFVNNECRGVANMVYVPELDGYLVFLMVYSNLAMGETVLFRVYNAEMDSVFIISEEVMFESDVAIGTPNDPFSLTYYTPSTNAEILEYSFEEQTDAAEIDVENHIIDIDVNPTANLEELIATFTLSIGASCFVDSDEQISGETPNDFSDTLSYIVMAEDMESSQIWKVVVTQAENLNHECGIVNFSFTEQTSSASIDEENHIVNIIVESGTDLTDLVAYFTLSNGAEARVNSVVQESGVTHNNFSYPIIYTVVAEDGVTSQNWIIITQLSTDMKELFLDVLVNVYPNPASETISVHLEKYLNCTLEIISAEGKIVRQIIIESNASEIDIRDLSNGNYIYCIKDYESRAVAKGKFIKR